MAADPPEAPWYHQELPPCPLMPERACPGECLYILPRDECAHEPRGRTRLRRLGIEPVWKSPHCNEKSSV
jgi:hypothetical protein